MALVGAFVAAVSAVLTVAVVYDRTPTGAVLLFPAAAVIIISGALAAIDWRVTGTLAALGGIALAFVLLCIYPSEDRWLGWLMWLVCLAPLSGGAAVAVMQRSRRSVDRARRSSEGAVVAGSGVRRNSMPRRAGLLPALLAGTSGVVWGLTGLLSPVLLFDPVGLSRMGSEDWLLLSLCFGVPPVMMLIGALMLGFWPNQSVGVAPVIIALLPMMPFLSGWRGALVIFPVVCFALGVASVIVAWLRRRRASIASRQPVP
jgi:hypothetical protein